MPAERRLELFGRMSAQESAALGHPGWTVFGNEIPPAEMTGGG
jgi:hypothetical protein